VLDQSLFNDLVCGFCPSFSTFSLADAQLPTSLRPGSSPWGLLRGLGAFGLLDHFVTTLFECTRCEQGGRRSTLRSLRSWGLCGIPLALPHDTRGLSATVSQRDPYGVTGCLTVFGTRFRYPIEFLPIKTE
jgi:hypothetical protein